jgi:hypothetical protein
MFLMRANTLCGEVGGELALEISSFVGPCEIARADRREQFGAQKTLDFQQLQGTTASRDARNIRDIKKQQKTTASRNARNIRDSKQQQGITESKDARNIRGSASKSRE